MALGGHDQLNENLKDTNGDGVTGDGVTGDGVTGDAYPGGSGTLSAIDAGDVPIGDEMYSFFPYVYNRVDSEESRGKGTLYGGVTPSERKYPDGQICAGVKERPFIHETDVGREDASFQFRGTIRTMGFCKKQVGVDDYHCHGDDCHGEDNYDGDNCHGGDNYDGDNYQGEYPLREHLARSNPNEEDMDGEFHHLRSRDTNGELSNNYITYKQYVLKRNSNGRSRMEDERIDWGGNSDTSRFAYRGYASDGGGVGRGEGIIENGDFRGNVSEDLCGDLGVPPWEVVNREGVSAANEMKRKITDRRKNQLEQVSKNDTHHVSAINSSQLKTGSSDIDAVIRARQGLLVRLLRL